MSEKTEDATEHKLEESRKKGQVNQSQDVPKLLISIGVLETISALVENGMQRMQNLMLLPLSRINDTFEHALKEEVSESLSVLILMVGTVVAIALVLRILGGWVQFGPLFAVEAVKPKFENLNPAHNFKNMFSLRQMTQLLTSIIKAAIIGLMVWQSSVPELSGLAHLASGSLEAFWLGVMALFMKVAHSVLLVMLLLSLLDFGVQKYFYLKEQRMSHEDIKNEYKESEGDPEMKGHRRKLTNELLLEEPVKPRKVMVNEADVLLVNPTHFAIGLYYCPGETPLPRLVFKAKDSEAHLLIEEAQRNKVPVIRYIWLTRTLFRTTKEGAYIPRETLTAVAQVYRLLRELEDQYLDEIIEVQER